MAGFGFRHGAHINARLWGKTPLMEAVEAGHLAAARILVENGADVNARTRSGTTALGLASMKGQGEIVRLFHTAGAKE
jgi:ankyrin repeat protein